VRIIVAVVLAAAATGGCGSSSDSGRSASNAAPTQVTTNPTAKTGLAPACSRRARINLARETGLRPGLIDASPFTAASGASGCRLRGVRDGLTVIIQLDSAPQAYTRLERQIVEYGQNVLHSGDRSTRAPSSTSAWTRTGWRPRTGSSPPMESGWSTSRSAGLRRAVTPVRRSRSSSPASTSGPSTTRTRARPRAAPPPGRAPAPPGA
jgi:hypothetical protein